VILDLASRVYEHNDAVFAEYRDGTLIEFISLQSTYDSESTLIFAG